MLYKMQCVAVQFGARCSDQGKDRATQSEESGVVVCGGEMLELYAHALEG